MQTQYCYDLPRLREYMACIRDLGLLEKVFVMVGVGPIPSARTGLWMRENVPGVHVPDAVIDRLRKAEKPKLEGRRMCLEMIQELREVEGVSGVHVMAYRQEDAVAEIIDASGVLEGRVPWYPGRDSNDQNVKRAG